MNKKFNDWEVKAKALGVYNDFEFSYSIDTKLKSDEMYKRDNMLICLDSYNGNSSKLVIPPVDIINVDAVKWNKSIEEIIISEGTSKLAPGLFSGCDNLKKITMNSIITYLPTRAFAGSNRLSDVIMNDNIKIIFSHAFFGCTSLKKIKLSNNLNEIYACAFFASALEEIEIPKSVRLIQDRAFSQCSKLKKIILNSNVIYESSKRIGKSNIFECSSVKEIYVPIEYVEDTKSVIEEDIEIIGVR